MAKKSSKERDGFFLDGKRVSLWDIVETVGGETWKNSLETAHRYRESENRYLKEKLGDYLSAAEIHKLTGIKPSMLDNWRRKGIIESAQLRGKWYYSVNTIIAAIKSQA